MKFLSDYMKRKYAFILLVLFLVGLYPGALANAFPSGVPITIAQGTSALNIRDSFVAEDWNIGGNATIRDSIVRLTDNIASQVGYLFFRDSIHLNENLAFNAKFSFKIHDNYSLGADGMAFVIQSETNSSGSAGGGLGYSGISPSIAVEIDTWQNNGDPSESHLGVMVNGNTTDHREFYSTVPDIDVSNAIHTIWIDYDGTDLKVFMAQETDGNAPKPDAPVMSYGIVLTDIFTNTTDLFVGFTAATGGAASIHELHSVFFQSRYTEKGIQEPDNYVQAGAPSKPIDLSVTKYVGEELVVNPSEEGIYTFYGALDAVKPLASGTSFTIPSEMNTDGKVYYYSQTVEGRQSERGAITVKVTDRDGIFTSPLPKPYVSEMFVDEHLRLKLDGQENMDGATVTITDMMSGDLLEFEPIHGINGFYNPNSGVLTLSGNATVAQYEEALKSVKIRAEQLGISRQIAFTIGSSVYFDPTQHYYEYVTTDSNQSISWLEAKEAAEKRSYYGRQGYLATITSARENAFILEKTLGLGWIGGRDIERDLLTGEWLDENTKGDWRWVTGPEGFADRGKGLSFTTGYAPHIPWTFGPITPEKVSFDPEMDWYYRVDDVDGKRYTNWDNREPNNYNLSEYVLHIYNGTGKWNDFPLNSEVRGYVVEYGGLPTDRAEDLSVTDFKLIQMSSLGYAVTVEDGTGAGIYLPGDSVTLEAYTKSIGDEFKEWEVVEGDITLPNPTSHRTTFTMPTMPVKIRATYTYAPEHKLTVQGGTGSGDFTQHTVVEISAQEDVEAGKLFKEWKVVSGSVEIDTKLKTQRFTMPGNDLVLKAIYTYGVDVSGGSGSGRYTPGDTVTVTAYEVTDAGKEFDGFTLTPSSIEVEDFTQKTITFTMPEESVTVTRNTRSIPYNVMFDSQGGTPLAEMKVLFDALIVAPSAPTKAGYDFSGWYRDAGFETAWNFAYDKMPAADVILYAKWTPNADTDYAVLHYQEKVDGTGYDLFETEDLEGTTGGSVHAGAKTYTGFVFDEENPESVLTGTIEGDGSLVLKLYYDRVHYDYVFKNWNDEVIAEGNIPYGADVPVPGNPLRSGHTFTGWSQEIPEVMPAEPLTFKAVFSINSYTLTFNSNGGSSVNSITKNYGESVGTVEETTKEGYTFKGWSPTIPQYVPASNSTYEAQWEINRYRVSFEENGGTAVTDLLLDYNTFIEIVPVTTKAGYTFEGWYTEAALENKWDFEKDTIPAEHITLHAKWSANTNTKYVVNHYKEKLDGTYELEDQEEFTGITDTEITAPVKIYIGFSVDRTHEDEFATGIIDGSGTLELSLYYQRDSFEVVFKDWDGTVLKEVTLKYESGAKAPTGMTREGYTFTHWDEDFTKITEDLEVKAIYTINQYDVSFEENGGSEVLNLRQDFNTLIESNTATSRIGYTFEGWFTDAALETEWDFAVDKVPAQNITLYAKWSAKTDTVYKVKHYREALDGTYVEFEKEIKIGTTDTTGTAAANTYEGFTYLKDHEDEISSGNIRGDGSLVLELYYDRNEYRIIFRGFDGGVLVDDMMKYGESIELPEDPEKAGYIFKGWMKEVPETVPAKDESFESLWEITAAEEVRQKIEALPSLDEVGKEDGALLMEIKKLMDQLTEEELKYLKPEDIEKFQKSSTVYVEMSFTDEKTKVRVNAAENTYFDPNLKLVVEEVKLGALKDTADKNLLTIRKNKEILQVFDISLLLNNVEVQPDGIIRIYLPLSTELKNSYKDLEVIYVAEDGKITVMPSKVEGDYLVFETDHLSYYSIIGTKINALPSLGEETSSAALGFLLLAVGLCLYVSWRKRKTA
ncbi:InlB B-repeat-containing protein [Proteiniclasticum ruminis]|uniref:Listeria/Bacterioides repeat-containing protein n=1 Tax=Proteiniclasticum ruminis TaxID=398199 RepID=A0A1G8P982_9CLOT|nr:InlB B-repeat-containing protein [Proteiniclasticum ruminis]SDI89069.1 Listeria/Bacterioides repeat-containing protein [Proteiniclasticum ruminis]